MAGAFSGTLVPSTFLWTLMFLQTSFLVLGSGWHTRLVSLAAIVLVANTNATMVNNVFILFPYSAGKLGAPGPAGLLLPNAGALGVGLPKLGADGAPKLGAGVIGAPKLGVELSFALPASFS